MMNECMMYVELKQNKPAFFLHRRVVSDPKRGFTQRQRKITSTKTTITENKKLKRTVLLIGVSNDYNFCCQKMVRDNKNDEQE